MKNSIKLYRAKFSMTQAALSNELEVSRQTINAIENNKYFPSLELALKLSSVFDCKVDDLFQLD